MDKKSQFDKLKKILDPPTEFPMTQCLNRSITYREACIDYVKKTMRCVGYRDYVIAELEKLEQIEQIVKNYDGSMPSMIKQFSEIQKVLKQELGEE